MNQRRAKAIRKQIGFKVHKPRMYQSINTAVCLGQYRDKDGNLHKLYARVITADSDRQAYQHAKKQYKAGVK